MKLSVVVLATAVVASTAASIVNKNRAPKGLAAGQQAPRKLSLFVRTKEVSKAEMYGEKQPLFGNCQFGPCGANAMPTLATSLMGGGLQQPSQMGNQGGGGGGGADCHPKCWWSCGNADCDETCDPVCAPPQCETACADCHP